MNAPPDLNDPEQSAAYRRELASIARPIRYTGIFFVVLGLILAIVRQKVGPHMPIAIPAGALGLGMLNMIGAIFIRMRYHQLRMRG